MNEKEAVTKAVPDYDSDCEVCAQTPTVCIDEHGEVVHRTGLCGPCCFGEAKMLDPEEWNN